jgi:MFS family permease
MPDPHAHETGRLDSLRRAAGANRLVVALSVARLSDALGNSILFVAIPLYVAELPSPWFPLPESVRVGILISLYGFVAAAFQPLLGGLGDRLRRRKLLIEIGLILMAAGTLAFAFAGRFVDLVALRAVQGLGVAAVIPAAMALMTLGSAHETRGGSMGIYTTLRMVGFAVGPLLGGLLLSRLGFNAVFYTGAAFVALGLLLVHFWVEEIPGAASSSSRWEWRLVPAGILGAGFATFVMASAFSMMLTLEKQFNARLHETVVGFSVAFSALMVSRLLLQLPLGWLSDRIGRKPVIIGGLLLMMPSTALLGFVRTTLQLTVTRVVQGAASAGIAAPAFALAADLAKSGDEGRQMSIATMGFGFGLAAGPLIAGALDLFFFQLPFLVGGVMSLLGAWVVYRHVPETVHRGST